jgi:hypothetical protein
MKKIGAGLIIIFLFAIGASAQISQTGTLNGTVYD